MRECRSAKMRKCRCMKFLCIIYGCPAGTRKWHIFIFDMLLHNKKRQHKHAVVTVKRLYAFMRTRSDNIDRYRYRYNNGSFFPRHIAPFFLNSYFFAWISLYYSPFSVLSSNSYKFTVTYFSDIHSDFS